VEVEARPRLTGTFGLHAMLQLNETVEYGLGAWRASRDI
jgi:hypothetical protein